MFEFPTMEPLFAFFNPNRMVYLTPKQLMEIRSFDRHLNGFVVGSETDYDFVVFGWDFRRYSEAFYKIPRQDGERIRPPRSINFAT